MSAIDPTAALSGLMGGGGGGDPMGAQGAPPDASAPPEGPTTADPKQGDNLDNLRSAIDSIVSYMQDEPDPEDLAKANKAKQALLDLLASNQKMNDQAMGAGPGEKFVRKQTAAANSGGGY